MDQKHEPASRKKAVALSYNPNEDAAPKITAKGEGKLAARIIELAKENGIEVKQEAALTEALFNVELNREIPLELYEAVASILAYIFQKQKSLST